jgi:hypothetical protein
LIASQYRRFIVGYAEQGARRGYSAGRHFRRWQTLVTKPIYQPIDLAA